MDSDPSYSKRDAREYRRRASQCLTLARLMTGRQREAVRDIARLWLRLAGNRARKRPLNKRGRP